VMGNQVRICALINREIAKRINFAITDDQITLVESAEIDGFKERNLVSCLTNRFEGFLDKIGSKREIIKNHIEILKRNNNISVFLLIDDLDATFQNTDAECLSLSTFFSACRYLTQDVEGVCFRVSMRSDVWPTIRRYDESLDKLEQYVTELEWSADEFQTLLYKRIIAQSKENGFNIPPRYENEIQNDYENRVLSILFVDKIQWGHKNVHSYKVIHTLSYQRPRWAVQLCKLAQNSALNRRRNIISKDDIDIIWGDYGSKRIADLIAEHKHQCKQIQELISAFRGAERLLSRDELLLFIKNKILNHITPYIDSKKVSTQLEVANFLYRIGFLVARSDEPSGDYEHYTVRVMPDLLNSRTNNDFNMKWEIHPCYREALNIKKINAAQRAKRGL
ncbi:P-loop ATPase, Sll1717 family, partial [Aeromonas simiae]|uniref:P-loop ATPase, Sll1717 family n=1 Tax=Aeromonas simiae TaxID=218936 RepID=UPI0018DDC06A